MSLAWLGLRSKQEKPEKTVYKKGHLGNPLTAKYVPGAGWVEEGAPTPDTSSALPPPPKPSSTAPSSSATDAALTPAAPPTTTVGHPMTMTLANRYAKPAGASKAAGVVLPIPGIGRGRGQGGRGGPIKTFVPQAPGSTAAVTPEWMKKKTPTGSTSEEASTSTVNPFADSSLASPAESAAAESLPTPMEAELVVPTQLDQSADQGIFVAPTPAENPSAVLTVTPTDAPLESQESTDQSLMDDAFGGSAMVAAFSGGNGSSGGGALGGDPLADAFGGGGTGTSVGGLAEDDAFGGGLATTSGDGLDGAFGGGNDGQLDAFGGGGGGNDGGPDAFGGGGGGYGLDDFAGPGLDDTFGAALASGAIGQAGPALPSTESPVAAAGPKFPSRDGSETRTGEDFFGALPSVEGGAIEQGEEASSSGPALQTPSAEEAPLGAQAEFDVEAMEERAGAAAAQDYNGFSWQQMMETGQQWRDYGYPEDQVRGFLADYSVDLEVYDYWVWRYYPEWIDWYRSQQSQASVDPSADPASQQQQGAEQDATESAEPLAQDQPQASPAESALEPHLNEPPSVEQQDESEVQDNFQLSFSLGGDAAADSQLPAFNVDSATGPDGFGVALDTDASPMDESTAVTDADVIAESESLAAASMVPEASSSESIHLREDHDSSHLEAEPSQPAASLLADEHLSEAASALAAEDSFTADVEGRGQEWAPTTAPGQSAFANSGFDQGDKEDLFKESPYFNPMWDSGASPEQPSRSQSPFPGTSESPSAQAGSTVGDRSNIQAGGVSRELSFASSSFAPEATSQQENGSSQVQHVASLGSWLKQGQGNADTTRRPSVKLSGPLPWDLLSESSEEGLTPRERQSLVAEEEEQKPAQQTANGSAVQKAPAPDAKGMLTAKTLSIADQLATGLLTAGEHLQGRAGLFEQGRGALKKLTGNLVSSSSPPQLYNRSSARLAEIYGHESEGDEGDETPRYHPVSEATNAAITDRRSDMGPETPHDGSPPITPRSSRAAPSDEEEEEERPQARRKKTGDEPPSRQRSPEEQEDLQDAQTQGMTAAATETTMAEQSGDEAAPEELFADEDEEGWEGMEDLAPGQAAAEAAPDAAVAEGDDTEGWEGLESLAPAEAAAEAEGDDAEGWEEPEDLASAQAAMAEGDAAAEEVAVATKGELEAAAAGEPEAGVDMHQGASQEEAEEQQPGRAEEDASSQVNLEEAEEGWEGSDVLDLPAQASEAPESAQDESPTEDHVLQRLRAVETQLAARDSQVAALTQQLDKRSHMDAELASLRAELADSHEQLSAAQAESTSNASTLHAAQQEMESWKTQHAALQDSSSSELGALRQQLADSESYSDDLAKLKEQPNLAEDSSAELQPLRLQLKESESALAELEALRQQFKESESASAELEDLRQQVKESGSSSAELEDLRQQLKESEFSSAELATLRQQLKESETSSDELETLRQQLKESESVSSELEGLKSQLEKSESASSELHSVRQQLTEAKASNAKNSESLKEAEQQVAELQAELDELRASSASAAETASQAELEWKDALAQVHSDLQQQQVTLSEHESQHKELEKQLQSLTQELTESEAESASLSGRLQTATQSLSSSEARCTQLEAELQEERSARLIVESELDMLSQQPISRVGDDSPPGSSARKAEAAQQELQDVRAKCSTAEAHVQELEDQMSNLEEAKAAAEAAVQEHFAMRKEQTERIRKAKAGGVKGLPLITAEREDAILRADKAEYESTDLQAQLVSLQKKLHDYHSVASFSQSPAESAANHLHAESAPTAAPGSPRSQPPESSQNGDSDLSAQVDELNQQLEAAAMSASAREADLKSVHAELASERGMSESIKAALRTELAVLSQQAEADKAALREQVKELSSQQDAQRQEAEALSNELAAVTLRADSASAEHDSFAEHHQQLESEKAEMTQQLEGLLARAGQHNASEEELQRMHEVHQKLQEKVEALEEEAQENFDRFSAKEEECDRLEAQLSALQASHPHALQALQQEMASLRQQHQEETTRVQQEAEEQLAELQQQLQEQLLGAGSLTERVLRAEASSTKAHAALAAAEARADELHQQLTAAEEARDEFVDLLSPKKAPRPAGSPAPKATETQLRAALKAARDQAVSLETAATTEMAAADEAFIQLGDAETTIMLLRGVLEENGIDPEVVLSSAGTALSEEASTEYDDDDEEDDEEEEEEGEGAMAAVASTAEGEAQSPGQEDRDGSTFDSPASTSRAEQLQIQAPASPTSPSHSPGEEEEPPLQASASSPVLKAIPFMASAHTSTHLHEISLDAWGSGQQEAVDGWEEEDDWMNQ